GVPARGGGPASALRTPPSGKAPSVASPEATRPERRRNVRRSSPPLDWPASAAASLPRCASRSFLLINTGSSPSLRIFVDPVERLDVLGFLVARLALLLVGFGGRGRTRQRHGAGGGRGAGARRQHAKEIATGHCLVLRFVHGGLLRDLRPAAHAGNAYACDSISMNSRPSMPTLR